MITPMQKLSILCQASDTNASLEALRELGVLHVTPSTAPTGATHDDAQRKLEAAKTALTALAAHEVTSTGVGDTVSEDADALISTICELRQDLKHQEEQLTAFQHLHHSLLPYGEFKPESIAALAERGIVVKLYHARNMDTLEVPESAQLHILSNDKTGVHFAIISQSDFTVNASELHIPTRSLLTVEADITTIQLKIDEANERLKSLASSRDQVEQELHNREEATRYAYVHDTLGQHGAISLLSGFCPADAVDAVRAAAGTQGWGLLIEEPTEDDVVPTLLKLPRWVTPIKAVLKMLAIVPGYHESDISGVFLIFFSIFFAILIGDAGYGVLFLLATLWARKKAPKAPAYPFVLFGILSTCTIIWGAVTGNYFGIQTDALPGLLQGFQISWLTGPDPEIARNHVMKLCFLIGAVHLTIAHIWNIIELAPSPKAIAQLGWIGLVWSMYFTALNMVLQLAIPAFFLPLILGSIALILLFMTSPKAMKTEWIHHAMFPLSVVNCFVDIVSYIRLFAVGLASLSVAQSFNGIAMDLGWSRIWTIPLMALILLAGHGLNIILCALGILVHGVRLNTLEFSLHKD
jgi:V/A-type H+-transporting ATPase subunit I